MTRAPRCPRPHAWFSRTHYRIQRGPQTRTLLGASGRPPAWRCPSPGPAAPTGDRRGGTSAAPFQTALILSCSGTLQRSVCGQTEGRWSHQRSRSLSSSSHCFPPPPPPPSPSYTFLPRTVSSPAREGPSQVLLPGAPPKTQPELLVRLRPQYSPHGDEVFTSSLCCHSLCEAALQTPTRMPKRMKGHEKWCFIHSLTHSFKNIS